MRHLGHATTLALSPLLGMQGLWVRLRTPILPEAGPPFAGTAPAADSIHTPSTATRPLRLLVLGESTAAGVGVSSHVDGLAGCTAAALAACCGHPIVWQVLGRSGATAASVRLDLLPALPPTSFDLVLIALGVNDTIRMTPPATWRADMVALLDDLAAAMAPRTVLLAGVPPMERFPALPSPLRHFLGARSARLDRDLCLLAAQSPGVYHCPTPLPDPHHFAADRFHPGPAGYAAWSNVIVDRLCRDGRPPTS